MNKFLYITIVILLFTQCNRHRTPISGNNIIAAEDSILLDSTDILKPYDVFIKDSLLFFSVSQSPNHVSILNLNNFNCSDFFERGPGPNQIINYRRVKNDLSNIFSCMDRSKKIFYTINDNMQMKEEFRMCNEIPNIFNASPLNDSVIIATGIFPHGRILFYNKHQHTYSYQLNFPETEKTKGMPLTHKAILHNGTLIQTHNKKNKFVLISHGDVEFYLYKDEQPILLKSYKYHEPLFDWKKTGHAISYDKKSIVGFINASSDDEYIYLCYSDKTYEETLLKEKCLFGNKIIVYNWNGDYICECHLDKFVSSITVKNKQLWGISSFGDRLYRFLLFDKIKQ